MKKEFVPLKAAYLRRFFPSNAVYKQVREAHLASETIVCDGVCYQADTLTWRNLNDRHRSGKCYGYKLGPKMGRRSSRADNLEVQGVAQIDR